MDELNKLIVVSYTSAEAARVLNRTESIVDRFRVAKYIIGFQHDGRWHYPRAQFLGRSPGILPFMKRIIWKNNNDAAAVVRFLTTPRDDLDGLTVREAMLKGKLKYVYPIIESLSDQRGAEAGAT